MGEGLRERGIPEDVFGVTVGEGDEIGDALIDAVDFVMFTGSTSRQEGDGARRGTLTRRRWSSAARTR